MPRRSLRLTILIIAALLFFLGPSLIAYYTDWLWFGEVGYRSIYSKMLTVQFGAGGMDDYPYMSYGHDWTVFSGIPRCDRPFRRDVAAADPLPER